MCLPKVHSVAVDCNKTRGFFRRTSHVCLHSFSFICQALPQRLDRPLLIYFLHVYRCRFRCLRGLRRGSSAVRFLCLLVRIPPGTWMFVCCECCVLSGRGLCVGLIACPEESYRMCGESECDCKASIKRRSWPTRGCCTVRTNGVWYNVTCY
jgi:hypothetical protein